MTLAKYRLSEKEEFPETFLITNPTIHNFPVDFYIAADVDKVVEELQERIKVLVQHYDKHVGTPCEQLRHKQEVERLQADLARVAAELEQIKVRRVLPIDPYINTVNTVPEK